MEPVPPTERTLVEKIVKANARDEDGITPPPPPPPHFVARTGKTERVKALVEKVGYRYARDNLAGILSIAAGEGKAETVRVHCSCLRGLGSAWPIEVLRCGECKKHIPQVTNWEFEQH